MALKTVTPFPIFAPTSPTNLTNLTTTSTTTEIRFSRWNNANAEKHNNARRTQQSIEDDLRRHRRFESALNITTNYPPPSPPPSPRHHSSGTPSTPSLSSVPGRKSKYSRSSSHPAFHQAPKRTSLPPPRRDIATAREGGVGQSEVTVCDGEGGLKYVIPGAPFEFMYSYTEAPKGVRAVALREEAVAPFGPGTIPRPWTGKKPMSKKLLPEFDTFKPPPDGKKGVKSVQKPGPYLPGSGPRYVVTREEILGEELTREEVHDLIMGCRKTKRQLNMGRDGLTHNMLDNIHAHWKRRRVCKIKCKGVCTVDMDNVCQQLEEKAGGKIIYRRGGVVYLFRGRNYNFKTRPRFPLMLWKPITPVFPRLVKSVPEGLTYAEVTEMRKRGHELIPICKLGKNGVYVNLVKTVREAFEVCDLVRINCQGLNPSDYRKIGAKLKDLVPCILLSFKYEHILMCRGKDWRPSLLLPETGSKGYEISESDRNEFLGPDSSDPSNSVNDEESETDVDSDTCDEMATLSEVNGVAPNQTIDIGSESPSSLDSLSDTVINSADNPCERESSTARDFYDVDSGASRQSGSVPAIGSVSDLKVRVDCSSESSAANGESEAVVEKKKESSPSMVASSCTEGVLFLLKQALDNGSAVILDDSSLDGDVIFEKSVAFSKTAPPGPVFTHRPRKVAVTISENQASAVAVDETMPEMKSPGKKLKDKKSPRIQISKDFTEDFLDVVPQGSLKVDELAKLLA